MHVPQRGPKRELLDTVARNAAEALALHKTKRASDLGTRGRALEELQQSLAMASAPLRIEGFDISHLQGTEVVGSMVVFEDGLARKSEYRRFVIKSFEGSNDIAAMDEPVTVIANCSTIEALRLELVKKYEPIDYWSDGER